MMTKTAPPKGTKPTSYHDAKLIDASEDELVIEYQGERIELLTHCYSNFDTIGKTGIAQYAEEGGFWAFIPCGQ
jgi:hypothetical protein